MITPFSPILAVPLFGWSVMETEEVSKLTPILPDLSLLSVAKSTGCPGSVDARSVVATG